MTQSRPFRVFDANPLKYVDVNGRVQWEDRHGDVEVRFSVEQGLSKNVVRMVSEDMLALEGVTTARL